jgi:hypothetical protein
MPNIRTKSHNGSSLELDHIALQCPRAKSSTINAVEGVGVVVCVKVLSPSSCHQHCPGMAFENDIIGQSHTKGDDFRSMQTSTSIG